MDDPIVQLLSEHGIRPTANRIMIASALAKADSPMSMRDLEDELVSIDKSGIFRTLALFRKQNLVHAVENAEGMEYEICRSHGDGPDSDRHVHFHCRCCGRTLCLEDIPIPEVALPEGFEADSRNYIVTGTCPECGKRK